MILQKGFHRPQFELDSARSLRLSVKIKQQTCSAPTDAQVNAQKMSDPSVERPVTKLAGTSKTQ